MTRVIKVERSMDWDKWLAQQFVDGFNKATGRKYELFCHPDKETRHEAKPKKAVEAIYRDSCKGSLAVEHTRVEAFLGMLEYENKTFRDVWEPLKVLGLPEHFIWLQASFDWLREDCSRQQRRQASSRVKEWFLRERSNFPLGELSQDIPNSFGPLRIMVRKWHHGCDYPGQVSIASWGVKFGDPFQLLVPRVRKAVEDKLGKLVSTDADHHVLLMEIVEQNLFTVWDLARAVNILRPDFPGLDGVDVWATADASSGIKGTPSFHRLQDGDAEYGFLSQSEAVVRLIPSFS